MKEFQAILDSIIDFNDSKIEEKILKIPGHFDLELEFDGTINFSIGAVQIMIKNCSEMQYMFEEIQIAYMDFVKYFSRSGINKRRKDLYQSGERWDPDEIPEPIIKEFDFDF